MKIIRILSTVLALTLTAAAFPTDSTLEAVNDTTSNLGTVTFGDGTSFVQMAVGSLATVSTTISFTVSQVTAFGQTVTYPSNGPITTPNGATIYVNWPSTNYIEFTNTRVGNSPVRQ